MNACARNAARFPIGRTLITPDAQAALDAAGVPGLLVLARHVSGDWGKLPVEDIAANELALLTGKRLLSSYALPGDGQGVGHHRVRPFVHHCRPLRRR